MAALRMHSQPQNNEPIQQNQHVRRTNSLTVNPNRSNSLRSYTYNPKPSYVAGLPVIRGQPLHSSNQRSYSLSSQPSRSYGSNRAGSINSRTPLPISELQEDNDEDESVVTTQTTKMVDAQGRLTLITTKTIKTYADGSKEIETTTKNISRSGSRANSLTAAPRNNSILSAGGTAYNLTKIDEDLRDFDYNYEEEPLTLNLGLGEPLKSLDLTSRHPNREIMAEHRKEDVKSVESSPSKPLRSILKSTSRPEFHNNGDSQTAEEHGDVNSSGLDQRTSNFSTPNVSPSVNQNSAFKPLTQPPKLKLPATPSSHNGNIPHSPKSVISYSLPGKPRVGSPNSSIKFVNTVETIPIPRSEPKQLSERELYARAMEVAMQNVYGSKDEPVEALEKDNEKVKKLVVKDAAIRNSIAATTPGVNGDYVYQNHHRDFSAHSMRNGDPKLTTRKERAKEEKKKLKAQEKEEKNLKKLEEKEKKTEEKDFKRQKDEDKVKKKAEKKPLRSLFFGRRKSVTAEPSEQTSVPLSVAQEEPAKSFDVPYNGANESFVVPGSFLSTDLSEQPAPQIDQTVNLGTRHRDVSIVETIPESIPETAPLQAPSDVTSVEPSPVKSENLAEASPTTLDTHLAASDAAADLALNKSHGLVMEDVPSLTSDVPSQNPDDFLPEVVNLDGGPIEVPVLNDVVSSSSREDEEAIENSTAHTSLDPWSEAGSPQLPVFSNVDETLHAAGVERHLPSKEPTVISEYHDQKLEDLAEDLVTLEPDTGLTGAADLPTLNVNDKQANLDEIAEIPDTKIPDTEIEGPPEPYPTPNVPEESEQNDLHKDESGDSHIQENMDESLKDVGPSKQSASSERAPSANYTDPSLEVNSKKSKKGSRFKQKLFKYFINTYDK